MNITWHRPRWVLDTVAGTPSKNCSFYVALGRSVLVQKREAIACKSLGVEINTKGCCCRSELILTQLGLLRGTVYLFQYSLVLYFASLALDVTMWI